MSAPPPADDEASGFDPTLSFPPGSAGVPPPPRPSLETGNALPTGTYLGEFEVLVVVGEGGFGIVYKAWDHSLKRQVALKEYMPSSLAQRSGGLQVSVRSEKHRETFLAGLQSFVKEARMLAQFDHPALVKVFRFWEANGSAYMVMPFYEGITLREELRRRSTPPDEATLLGWLGPVADALSVIHAEHWFHRDIAPDNVLLLAGSRRPLLLDFGAARRVIGDMTQALTVILKPGYAPVEQYAEIPGMKQGPWTDVYALAALGYYAIRGRTPPPSVGRLVTDSYEPLIESAKGQYSDRVLRAIDHALAVRPESRTRDVAAFKAELGLAEPPSDFAHSEFPASRPVPEDLDLSLPADPDAKTQPGRPAPALEATRVLSRPAAAAPSRRPGLLGAGVAALAVAAAVAWWLWPAAPSTPPVPAQQADAGQARPAGQATPDLASAPLAVAPTAGLSPPAATPNVAPARAPGFDPVQVFARIVQAQTAGWAPQLSAERTRLRMDRDKLVFTLRSPHDGHVYVFNHGSDGALQQLYPNGRTPAPQVRAGQALTLPQGGLEFNVAGPPGPGQLLVLVSRWPRDHTTFAPQVEDGFTSFPTGAVAAALEAGNVGRPPLLLGQPVCAAGAECRDDFGAATLKLDVVP